MGLHLIKPQGKCQVWASFFRRWGTVSAVFSREPTAHSGTVGKAPLKPLLVDSVILSPDLHFRTEEHTPELLRIWSQRLSAKSLSNNLSSVEDNCFAPSHGPF